jgi:ATP phosphoribosyltransferase regulatory subunit
VRNTPAKRRDALIALVNSAGESLAQPPILLPASDYFDLAGEEFGRRLLLTEGADGTRYCLRPDFTLPIAQSYLAQNADKAAAYGYLGPVFRQRSSGPTEFEQAGLELLAQPDPEIALHKVFDFIKSSLALYDISAPSIRLGSVALFEALLEAADMPDVWRPRLRRRFGSPNAMRTLLQRLASPHDVATGFENKSRQQLIDEITEQMLQSGLSVNEGRQPEDIADRYLEKQALAAAKVPATTIELLSDYLQIKGTSDQAIDQVRVLLSVAGIELKNPLQSLLDNAEQLKTRFPNSPISFEAGFSPRLHYYTGLVFELLDNNSKTLASGGQYDRLLQALGTSTQISASGCALWVMRLEQEGMQ